MTLVVRVVLAQGHVDARCFLLVLFVGWLCAVLPPFFHFRAGGRLGWGGGSLFFQCLAQASGKCACCPLLSPSHFLFFFSSSAPANLFFFFFCSVPLVFLFNVPFCSVVSASVCRSVCLFVCLAACLVACQRVCLGVCSLSVSLPVCPSWLV